MAELTYTRVGDYLLPNLVLDRKTEEMPLGKYGRMREKFLREHRNEVYLSLLRAGQLKKHLRKIDQQAQEQVNRLVAQLKKQRGVTEELKASNQMAWVQAVNNCIAQAEEVVLAEIVYN